MRMVSEGFGVVCGLPRQTLRRLGVGPRRTRQRLVTRQGTDGRQPDPAAGSASLAAWLVRTTATRPIGTTTTTTSVMTHVLIRVPSSRLWAVPRDKRRPRVWITSPSQHPLRYSNGCWTVLTIPLCSWSGPPGRSCRERTCAPDTPSRTCAGAHSGSAPPSVRRRGTRRACRTVRAHADVDLGRLQGDRRLAGPTGPTTCPGTDGGARRPPLSADVLRVLAQSAHRDAPAAGSARLRTLARSHLGARIEQIASSIMATTRSGWSSNIHQVSSAPASLQDEVVLPPAVAHTERRSFWLNPPSISTTRRSAGSP